MIERVVIEGRPGSACYVDSDFVPVEEAKAKFLKVVFDDGGQLTLAVPPGSQPRSMDVTVPVARAEAHERRQRAWHEAKKQARTTLAPRAESDPAAEKRRKKWEAAKVQAKTTLVRGDFIQDPDTGRFAGSHPGGGGGGEGGKHPGAGYSKDAYVKGGVIHTSNVDDAARALHEGKKVELDQPRKISVLIDKLGQMARDAIAKGEKAPVYNLCNVSVTGTNLFCAESKGIPRVEMPQLTDAQAKAFTTHLGDQGYKVTESSTPASHLRATQNELNGAKVAKLAGKMRAEGGMGVKRIFVSKDDYILDGHHHWAA
jgi:hypothetical protein